MYEMTDKTKHMNLITEEVLGLGGENPEGRKGQSHLNGKYDENCT